VQLPGTGRAGESPSGRGKYCFSPCLEGLLLLLKGKGGGESILLKTLNSVRKKARIERRFLNEF